MLRKERERKERGREGRKEGRKEGRVEKQNKETKNYFPPKLFFNGICKTMTCIILNDFQNQSVTNLVWLKNLPRIFPFLTGKS